MKIVILDSYTNNPGDLSWDDIEKLGELTVYERTPEEEDIIVERVGDADILIVSNITITKNILDRCPAIKAIAVLATGYNFVDLDYARSKGIPVMNVPAYGTRVVSQYAVGLLLEICSHYGHHARAVTQGKWTTCKDFCFWDYPMIELYGKTAGIIGAGRIGQATAKILDALGMKVIAYNKTRHLDLAQQGKETDYLTYVNLETLYKESDVIFLHCPLNKETEDMICRESIAKMKDGVILINNSRGGLIVEEDLLEALQSGKIYVAGLDVVREEPARQDNPLLKAPNCIITPHISWAAVEARKRIIDITAYNIESFLNGNPVNVVNDY